CRLDRQSILFESFFRSSMDARVKPAHDGACFCSVGSAQRHEECRNASGTRLRPEMLAQLQALRLIVGADALAVERVGARQHFFVDQAADDLAVLEDERYLARAHFQHRARTLPAGAGIAEAGIEEARIMHAELADQWVER